MAGERDEHCLFTVRWSRTHYTLGTGRRRLVAGAAGLLTVSLLVGGPRVRRRPGGQLAQAHGAVERLVAQGQRGHGAAAAAGPGSRRLFDASVRPPSASVRHCRASAAFFRRFFSRGRGEAAGQWRRGPPRPRDAPASLLLFTCRILKGFSACRYGFSSASYVKRRPASGVRRPASRAPECRSAYNLHLPKNLFQSSIHFVGSSSFCRV